MTIANQTKNTDIRLIMPVFLAKKLPKHPLTKGLYPLALGKMYKQSNNRAQNVNQPCYSLIYCLSQQALLHYKDKNITLKYGDLVILSPYHDFTFSLSKQTEQEQQSKKPCLYWINFTGNLADDFAERLLMKMEQGVANIGRLNNITQDLDHLLALGRRGYTATNVIHAVHILQQALSYLALQLRVNDFNKNSRFDLNAVESLMQNNLHQELSLDTLAHYSQLSKFHFAKKFKELTDTSPIQHFINMKIQHACYQLDNSDLAIKEIASNVGYSDPYYFSRLFKKMVGMSPKQYRDSRYSV